MTVIDTLTAPYVERRSRAAARSRPLPREVLPLGAPPLPAPAADLRLVPTRRTSTVRGAAMGASLIFHLAIAASLVGLIPAPRDASAPAAIPVRLLFVDPTAAPQDSTAIPATAESPAPMPATVEPIPLPMPATPVTVEPVAPAAPERPPPPKPRQRPAEPRPRAASPPSPPTPSVAPESSSPASPAAQAALPLARAEALPSHGIRPIEQPAPPYPGAARRQGIEGDVILQLSVDEAGKLISVAVARGSGHRVLDEAAIAAVKLWRFEPAVVDGRPVAAVAELPVRFRLAGG
jgi:protein TonB